MGDEPALMREFGDRIASSNDFGFIVSDKCRKNGLSDALFEDSAMVRARKTPVVVEWFVPVCDTRGLTPVSPSLFQASPVQISATPFLTTIRGTLLFARLREAKT